MHTESTLRSFLLQIQLATKIGRKLAQEEAREFYNYQKMEFERMINMMNRVGFCVSYGDERWTKHFAIRNHHKFTQELCRQNHATRVIQRAFRWYRYNPGERFCNRVQIRKLCDMCPDMNFNEEILELNR